MFEVGWCVMLYTTVLFLEFTVPLFEWLGWRKLHGVMKKTLEKPEFSNMKLVATVYGDDQSDKSYREAIGLLRSYPNLKAIIAPTTPVETIQLHSTPRTNSVSMPAAPCSA